MRIPGGYRYSGADLGFDALVIAASTTVEGFTVPWRALAAIFSVELLYFKSSALAANANIQAETFDFDGQTVLVGFTSIVAPVADDSVISVNNALISASTGTAVPPGGPIVMGAPYLRFRISNTDAVNAITVTLQAEINFEIGL